MTLVIDRPDPGDAPHPREVASLFNVTPKTISRWDAAGILPAIRTKGGHRRFPAQAVYDLLAFLEGVGEP